EDAAELAAGDTFSCARRRNGTVWCWGDNRLGQLGTGANITRSTPAVVGDPTLDEVTSISAGGAHTCAVRQGAPRALCWGDNQAGQLGDGTRLDRSLPAALKLGLDAVQVVTGALHTCLRDSSGAVWCWGRGGSGQLGNSGLIDLVLPTRVAAVTNTTSLAAGRAHTCAILNDGGVRCWGANGDGQLGDGTNENRATPIAVPGVANVVELALGGAHTCARHVDGAVSCWGRGLDGQLGDGGTINTGSAVQVRDLGAATAIAAGGNHSCAIVADRSVRCWGAGALGQLGWGTLSSHAVPSKVMNLGGVVRIAAGEAHTCARTSTSTSADGQVDTAGSVLCWGDNRLGQLGNGTSAPDPGMGPSAAAAAVNGDALEIAAGGAHSCATRRDRTTVCWGANDAGQLGDAIVLQYPTAQLTKSPCP
ncbi:MAG: RCC1 repeat-containing protein, partial [Myxococcales bacterium]